MLIGEAIRTVMKITKTTQNAMARRIGVKTQSVISARLTLPNLNIDTVIEMLDVLDYELVIQEKKRGRRPEGQILIERSNRP